MAARTVVLVIEDERGMMDFLKKSLLSIGIFTDVEIARSGQEALQKFAARTNEIAGILVDGYLLNDESSVEVCQKIRAQFSGPMVAMSRDPKMRMRQMKAGCDVETGDKFDAVETLVQALKKTAAA